MQIFYFQDSAFREPFSDWFKNLKDVKAKARILTRLNRIEIDNHFGDTETVGDGVFELRFHFGPGYRIYYGKDGDKVIILLCGGIKKSQKRDIAKAKEYWEDYLSNQ